MKLSLPCRTCSEGICCSEVYSGVIIFWPERHKTGARAALRFAPALAAKCLSESCSTGVPATLCKKPSIVGTWLLPQEQAVVPSFFLQRCWGSNTVALTQTLSCHCRNVLHCSQSWGKICGSVDLALQARSRPWAVHLTPPAITF